MNRRGFIKSLCAGVAVATVAPAVIVDAVTSKPVHQGLWAQVQNSTVTSHYSHLTLEKLERAIREITKKHYKEPNQYMMLVGRKPIL